jgi:hypothetical protein
MYGEEAAMNGDDREDLREAAMISRGYEGKEGRRGEAAKEGCT